MEQDLTTEEQHDAAGLGSLLSARVQSCMHADTHDASSSWRGDGGDYEYAFGSCRHFFCARIYFYFNMAAGRVRSIENRMGGAAQVN